MLMVEAIDFSTKLSSLSQTNRTASCTNEIFLDSSIYIENNTLAEYSTVFSTNIITCPEAIIDCLKSNNFHM